MNKVKFTTREKRIFSITLSIWGAFLVISGIIMNAQAKPIIKTTYNLKIDKKKIDLAQEKTNEIKLKDIEIEINTPISLNIKDYLEDADKINEDILKTLKIDTSRVNINEANNYQYTITYKKKKYIGTIKVKQKALPNITITLKEINLTIGEALSSSPRAFIKEEITDEVYNNLTLDLSKVKQNIAGTYDYYITYNGITYQQKVIVKEPGPTIITPKDSDELTCPENSNKDNDTCVCAEGKIYNKNTKKCEDNTIINNANKN